MIKYESEMIKHVAESAARILTLGGLIVENPDGREPIELAVCRMLQTAAGRKDLSSMIECVLSSIKTKDGLNGVLTRTHVKNTMRLVNMTNDIKMPQVIENEDNYFDSSSGQGVLERLSYKEDTVMSYHDLETYGGAEALQEMLRTKPGLEHAVIEVHKTSDLDDFLDKKDYMNKKVWVYTPLLPMVLIMGNKN